MRLAVIALVLALAIGGLAAKPAEAGNCTLRIVCGMVFVRADSEGPVRAVSDWSSKRYLVVRPNSVSYPAVRDADGFYVPPGYNIKRYTGGGRYLKTYYFTGWYKINDLEKPRLRLVKQ